MSILITIVLIMAVAFLLWKFQNVTEQLERFENRLADLEWRLSSERQRSTPPSPAESPAPTAPVAQAGNMQAAATGTAVAAEVDPLIRTYERFATSPGPVRTAVPPILPEAARTVPISKPLAGQQAPEPGESAEKPLSSSVPPQHAPPSLRIDWEQFMGVKLFAWIGGFVLFLGVAFFIKYSFERNLIPPEVRAGLGFLLGIGLVMGGVMMKRREFAVTSHTLCATGVVILYAVTFACRSVYHFTFFGPGTTFAIMVLVTVAAFILAVKFDALVVAILGLVGGFLTPLLLSTGTDNPLGLFSYVALLDIGLIAVAFRRRWHFLILMGAVGTLVLQLAWVVKFFAVEKVFIAMAVFLGFDLLFCLAFLAAERRRESNEWTTASAVALPLATIAFTMFLLSFNSLGARPGVVFSFVLGADLCLMAITLARPILHRVHMFAGTAAFFLLAAWTVSHLTPDLLFWALGMPLVFAALHTLFPVLLVRIRPQAQGTLWGHLYPPLALLLILLPILKLESISLVVWPTVLLIDVLAIAVAVLTGSAVLILAVLLLTGLATGVWLLQLPTGDLDALPELLTVIGGFAVFFFVAALALRTRLLAQTEGILPNKTRGEGNAIFDRHLTTDDFTAQIPAFSAILPFLLLIMVSARLPLANPSPVFGLAMLLVGLLLGLGLVSRLDALVPVSLACVIVLQSLWHTDHFRPESAWVPLLWSVAFYAVFTGFPFLFRAKLQNRILPWAAAALAGPLHFYLVYRAASLGFAPRFPGLLPAVFAVPMLVAMAHVNRTFAESAMRLNLLAWFGGSALFFITLIFPIQFERQWITIGWALEGLALIWLFHHVPHPGLRGTGVVLLAIAFTRLALNPAVLSYHPSATAPIFNWYLYAYGVVSVCLLLGARLLAPPRNRAWDWNIPPFLYTLGTILAFLLVNIEIADYFSDGRALTFQFSGNFARDMSYSVAWALFALALLIIGIWKRQGGPRYAAIGLLFTTLLKLFFHDLSQLGQPYRIAAFLVVAVILILASFLYQRFVSFDLARRQDS